MTIGRPKSALHLTSDEEAHLKSLVASRSVSHALGTRARIILVSQGGLSNTAIAGRLGLTRAALGQWRQRFIRDRIAGLQDDLRAGRPRTHADERLAALLTKTPQTQPAAQPPLELSSDGSGHRCGEIDGPSRLADVWAHPQRQRPCTLSTDPFSVEKVHAIVGLYLNPPDKALVLCVDEKTQIQALNRTPPILPLGLGYVEGGTHD